MRLKLKDLAILLATGNLIKEGIHVTIENTKAVRLIGAVITIAAVAGWVL